MINLLLALAVAAVVGLAVVVAGFPWYAALLPALLVFPVVLFLLARRTGNLVQAEAAAVQGLLAEIQQVQHQPTQVAARLDEVRARLAAIAEKHGRWQFLLKRQLEAQIGMIDYMQQRFDAALPRLEAAFRDATCFTAAACIHARAGRDAEAAERFDWAKGASPKEPSTYVVQATLLDRKGRREEALGVLAKGLEQVPDNQLLKQLKNTVANKRPIDVAPFAETWYRFFPEEAAQQMLVRGRRGAPVLPPGVSVPVRTGPPQPRPRGKLARRR